MIYAQPITRLVKAFSGLPGIGEKTATRLALYVLNAKSDYVDFLARSILDVKENIKLCSACMAFSDIDLCRICSDSTRDPSIICVVGDYREMAALEESAAYRGRYHVLHGLVAPLKGIGPDDIKTKELLSRASINGVKEVIIALSFDAEGETTAHYITNLLRPLNLRITRIASGVPVGGSIEYMDPTTLFRAMNGRKEV